MASVTITWTEATPVGSLLPYSLIITDSTGVTVSSTAPAASSNSAVVSGLAGGTTYTLALRAQGAGGYSAAATRTFTTPTVTSPPPPPPTRVKRFIAANGGSPWERQLPMDATAPRHPQAATLLSALAVQPLRLTGGADDPDGGLNTFQPASYVVDAQDPIYHIKWVSPGANGYFTSIFQVGGPGIRIPTIAKQYYQQGATVNEAPMLIHSPPGIGPGTPGTRGYYAFFSMLLWVPDGIPQGTDSDTTGHWECSGAGASGSVWYRDTYGTAWTNYGGPQTGDHGIRLGTVWPSPLPGTNRVPDFYHDEDANGGFRGIPGMCKVVDYDRVKAESRLNHIVELFAFNAGTAEGYWPMTSFVAGTGTVPSGTRLRIKPTVNVATLLAADPQYANNPVGLAEATAIARGLQEYGCIVNAPSTTTNYIRLSSPAKEGRGVSWAIPRDGLSVFNFGSGYWDVLANAYDSTVGIVVASPPPASPPPSPPPLSPPPPAPPPPPASPPPPAATRPVVVPLAGTTPPKLRRGSPTGAALTLRGCCVWGIDDLVSRAVQVGGVPFWQNQYNNRNQVVSTIRGWGSNILRLRVLADAYNGEQNGITKATRLQQITTWRDLATDQGMYFMPVWWDSLDGSMQDAGWATAYTGAHQMMTDVRNALKINGADDPMVIYELFNEPNQVSDAAWLTAMQNTVAHWRSFLGYTGVLVIDTNNWSHRYRDDQMTALENYDAGIAVMNGKHQLVFAKHDYGDEYPNKDQFTLTAWANNDGVGGTSPWQFNKHLVLETEYGNYNIDGQSHPAWSGGASTQFANILNDQTRPSFVGAIPFLFGPWSDGNAMTGADNQTPTTWGALARDNFLQRVGVPISPPPPSPSPPPASPPPSPPPTGVKWTGHQPGQIYLGESTNRTLTAAINEVAPQRLGLRRTYAPGGLNDASGEINTDHASNRLPWVSAKASDMGATASGAPAQWDQIAGGGLDANIRQWADMIGAKTKPVVFTFWHEPSNDANVDTDGARWAAAWENIYDVFKARNNLRNCAMVPILGDWLFNPKNGQQDPLNWLKSGVISKMAFLGIDAYENASGEAFDVRMPRIITWVAQHGRPGILIGIGETGSTDAAYPDNTAVEFWNKNWNWAAANPDKMTAISYFNSDANSRDGVYWPLDESTAKLNAFKTSLASAVTCNLSTV